MTAEATVPDAVVPAKAGTHSDAPTRRHSRESGNPMSFARYAKYKDSGVEWLGEVPEHWEIRRARFLFEIRKRIAGALGYDVLSVTQSGIRVKDIDSNDGQLSMDYSKYQIVEHGDFAMNHMDLLTGYVDISSLKGVTSPDYRVFSVRTAAVTNARYLLYILQMGYQQKIFFAYGQGSSQLGRWRLPTEQFNDLRLPLPARREQDAIAAFLDRETAKIDALMAEQEKLSALLKEKRQALISYAVTKGLDPNAPMKDSGIEWLGQVPAHWDVMPIWLMFELGRGRVISHEEIAAHEGPFPVYSSQTESDGEMGRIDTYDFEGDYLTWTTDGANAGTVFRRSGRFNCTNVCGTLKAKSPAIDLGYMVCALGASTSAFVRLDINPKLMNNVMARIRVPVPPQSEQRAISSSIVMRTDGLYKLIEEATRAIGLLKERRNGSDLRRRHWQDLCSRSVNRCHAFANPEFGWFGLWRAWRRLDVSRHLGRGARTRFECARTDQGCRRMERCCDVGNDVCVT